MEALTPAYAPPEMFHSHPATESGDVYSLAATLYALLAGHPPRWPTDGHTPTLPELIELHATPAADLPQVPPAADGRAGRRSGPEGSERPTAAQFRDQLAAVDLGPDATVDRRAMALTGGGTGASGVVVASPSTDPSQEVGDPRAPVGPAGDRSGGRADAGEELSRETTGDRSTRRRDRTLFLAVLILVVALLATGIVYVSLTGRAGGPGRRAVTGRCGHRGRRPRCRVPRREPVPVGRTHPSPEPVDGFVDCAQLGDDAVCPDEPECWGGSAELRRRPRGGDPDRLHRLAPFPDLRRRAAAAASPARSPSWRTIPRSRRCARRTVLNQRLADRAGRRAAGRSSRSRTRCSPRPTTSAAAW